MRLMADSVSQTLTVERLRERVKRTLQTRGVRATARLLGLSRDATLAVAAGAPVHAGTFALVRQNSAGLAE